MLDPDETVAYSGALTNMKKLMDSLGFEGKLYGEHSGKIGGAKTAVVHGATEKRPWNETNDETKTLKNNSNVLEAGVPMRSPPNMWIDSK